MKLYIKQKVFSFKDKFSIFDENEDVKYTCEGEIFSLGKKLHLYDKNGEECAFIRQKLLSFMPKFFIETDGLEIEAVKKITFMKPKYELPALGWVVEGDFLAHDYTIKAGDRIAGTVGKKWFSWGDTYEVFSVKDEDMKKVLCAVLVIDAIMAQQSSAAAISASSSSN